MSPAARPAIAVSALICVLLLGSGLAAGTSQSIVPLALVSLSAIGAIALVSAMLGGLVPAARQAGSGHRQTGDIEERIEILEDLRWETQDSRHHFRALLDAQDDIIIRRDTSGRVTFVNRAFVVKFDLDFEDILGRQFAPVINDGSNDAADNRGERTNGKDVLPVWARTGLTEVTTNEGVRWIAWSHRTMRDPVTGKLEVHTIGRDVTEAHRHERELADARDQALAADRAKSRFLASMSHEIRTPMNGILGMAGLLIETDQTDEQRTYTQAVRQSALTLRALIDEILDFSKVEAGRVELASEPVDIIDCVQGVVELLAPRAYQKQLELAWMIAPDMPRWFLGDETRIRQMLLNIIGNAVKFTECGGVAVWVGRQAGEGNEHRICIEVRDTGPGLDQDARQRIFMEFERAVPERFVGETGTGLGLAIARRLARHMGGDIIVHSERGQGATFILTMSLSCYRTAGDDTASLGRHGHHKLAGRHVAIVSPGEFERAVVARFLRMLGMTITETHSLEALLRVTGPARQMPDTVLLDCSVEPAAARSTLDTLRARGTARARNPNEPPRLEAAVIAASGNRSEFERFRAVGIEQFLVRPIRPQTMLALLNGEVDKSSLAEQQPETSAQTRSLEYNGSGLRVLVAEDNEINALLTRTILTRIGAEPIVAANGREAVDEVARALAGTTPPIDVVLMDMQMPVLDGFGATAEIVELYAKTDRPRPAIIAVTANAFQQDRERCLEAGMDGYLAKPFEPGDLRRVLQEIAEQPAADCL